MIPSIASSNQYDSIFTLPEAVTVEAADFDLWCMRAYQEWCVKKIKFTQNGIMKLIRDSSLRAEAYRVSIHESGIRIEASEEQGILHGLATVCQLTKNNALPCCEIEDAPKLQHRGLSLDCARHFFPVREVKKIIDYLWLLKMNRLHWHLTDDQGWRVPSRQFPKLTENRSDFYSQEDIREIVEYARVRGIEVIPEVDMPGHMTYLLHHYPDYGCEGSPTETVTAGGVFHNILCPGKESVFEMVEKLLGELIPLFPSKFFHIGGDEVPKSKWEQCPDCRKRMEELGLGDYSELQSYFMHRIAAFLKQQGKAAVCWNDVLTGKPENTDLLIQYWSPNVSDERMLSYMEQGGNFVFSNSFQYYFNFNHSMLPLKKVYERKWEIAGKNCSDYPGFAGIECALWTEEIAECDVLEKMLFPRILAFAERGWSGTTDYDAFLKSAEEFCEEYGSALSVTEREMWDPEGEKRTAQILQYMKSMLANRAMRSKNKSANQSIDRSLVKQFAAEFLRPSDIPMILKMMNPTATPDLPKEQAEPGVMHDYEKKHLETIRKLAPECMVQLKKDKPFCLQQGDTVALYGGGARRTQKGGTGSGDVNSFRFISIEQALEEQGFFVATKDWLDTYDQHWQKWQQENIRRVQHELKQKKFEALVFADAGVLEGDYDIPLYKCADKAVYVLSRISGEGQDRALDGNFRLTETEIRDICVLAKIYENFILVLNVGGIVDLSPVVDCVGNILLLSQLGAVTSESLVDVLTGRAYPSGKLTATWAKEKDYAYLDQFGQPDDSVYKEGIFVGYRGFDKRNVTPLFPFGYGLMNSSFSISVKSFDFSDGDTKVCISVKNTGNAKAQEIVQLYVKKPSDFLEQPEACLAAFAKTSELVPDQEEIITLACRAWDIASFDPQKGEWVLEQGDYLFFVGTSSRDLSLCGTGSVERCLSASLAMPKEDPYEKYRRKAHHIALQLSKEELAAICMGRFKESDHLINTIGQASVTVAGAAGETTDLCINKGVPAIVMADGPAGLRLDLQYGRDEQGVYTVSNLQMERYAKYIPAHILAMIRGAKARKAQRDGTIFDQHCTAIPIGSALAQSWNEELCRVCGDIVGDEMERHGVHLWLAPALNIQRLPLCGRNFEYYSEDPLVSGKIAAAITKGVQSHPGRGVTVKHFAANNQETNRYRSNSVVDPRALHEIYLKGFELCIKDAQPHALMTSYNLINGTHVAEDPAMLKELLRKDWGYCGLIMSDWVTGNSKKYMDSKYAPISAAVSIAAGNDLFMPGSSEDYREVLEAVGTVIPENTLMAAAERNMAVYMYLAEKKQVVACLGDSITFGAGALFRISTDSYPAILASLLGNGYEIHNFGYTGATASDKGDLPYVQTDMYKASLNVKADTYIIMLGTNDTKPSNWDVQAYLAGMVGLIQSCRKQNPDAAIYVAIPPAVFPDPIDPSCGIPFEIDQSVLHNKLPNLIWKIGQQMGCRTIDLFSVTQDHPEWFSDGCHPNRLGNETIASQIAEIIQDKAVADIK